MHRSEPRVKWAAVLTESVREFESLGREDDANAGGACHTPIVPTKMESAAASSDPRLTSESPTFAPLSPGAGTGRAVKQNRPALAGRSRTPRSERVQTVESRSPRGFWAAVLWLTGQSLGICVGDDGWPIRARSMSARPRFVRAEWLPRWHPRQNRDTALPTRSC